MTTNAADLLIEFFEADDKSHFKFAPLWAAIVEIEQNVECWKRLGQDSTAFESSLVAWKRVLNNATGTDFSMANMHGNHLESGDLGVLRWVSEKLAHTTPEFTEETRESVREGLAAVRTAILDDASLPDDLRLHIARLVLHVEESLDDWTITGDFVLADALDRLFGAVRIAESRSTTPSRWAGVWEDTLKDIAIGLIVQTPTLGIGFAQLLQIAQ